MDSESSLLVVTSIEVLAKIICSLPVCTTCIGKEEAARRFGGCKICVLTEGVPRAIEETNEMRIAEIILRRAEFMRSPAFVWWRTMLPNIQSGREILNLCGGENQTRPVVITITGT